MKKCKRITNNYRSSLSRTIFSTPPVERGFARRILMIVLALALGLVPISLRSLLARDLSAVLEPSEVHYSLAQDADSALKPLKLFPEDKYHLFPPSQLGIGSRILIWRAPTFELKIKDERLKIRSWKKRVKEILADNKIEIGEQDRVSPTLDAEVAPGAVIEIVRVAETKIVETEQIDYRVTERDDPELERGKTRIAQEGKKGKRELAYLVRRENGQEVSRALISNKITEEAQNKIILHGTKIVVLSEQSGIISWTKGVTASRRYRRGTKLRVTNLANGKSAEVFVGGWGPAEFTGFTLDLEQSAFEQIADLDSGTFYGKVEELAS